jgi:RNA polymerase sigma-70 factor, ECF subfamily
MRRFALERSGERERDSRAIANYRDYLLLVADRAMSPALKSKECASDLVQEAMLAAHRASRGAEMRTPVELRSWLRRLLLNRVAHAARRYQGTEKRRLRRELSLDTDLGRQAVADALAIDAPSPDDVAMRREEEARMLAAIDRLPDRMRFAVMCRYEEGCGFDEIGRRLDCSNVAARNLWLRALDRLRRELSTDRADASID